MRAESNIILIGAMGSGKSTVGEALAFRLGLKFIDIDREVEKQTGVTIATIFEIEGEKGFRIIEKELLNKLLKQEKIVIATGGGAILDMENRRAIHSSGYVIYLRAQPATLIKRLANDKTRPLLKKDAPEETIRAILKERSNLYEATAHLTLDVDAATPKCVVRKIEVSISKWK